MSGYKKRPVNLYPFARGFLPTMETGTIISTKLGPEDHGIFTNFVFIKYGAESSREGCEQGFGGYFLTKNDSCSRYIAKLLETLGANSWEDLIGVKVRFRIDDGLIVSVGHATKEQWFTPKIDIFGVEESVAQIIPSVQHPNTWEE